MIEYINNEKIKQNEERRNTERENLGFLAIIRLALNKTRMNTEQLRKQKEHK